MFGDWMKAFSRPDWHNASQRMQLEYLQAIYEQNKQILDNQSFIIQKINEMDKNVQALIDAVAAEQTVEQSAITLLQQLASQVQSGIDAGDLAAIQATVTQIKANSDALAAAVTQNTPASAPAGTGAGAAAGTGIGAAAGSNTGIAGGLPDTGAGDSGAASGAAVAGQ